MTLFLRLGAIFALFVCLSAEGSQSITVYNNTSKIPVVSDNASEVRPIASLSKLMTAIVAIERLPKNKTNDRLIEAMLIKSDNHAAEKLAASYPGGRVEFVKQMNLMAWYMRMDSMTFHDPSGLSVFNVASAHDVAALVLYASTYDRIQQITHKPVYNGLTNTNGYLLSKYDGIDASKTGFTNAAGYCLAMVVERHNEKYAVVVLGAKSKQHRIQIAEQLIRTL